MNLKDQVVSLELAKKLKELGFKQDSYQIWAKHKTYEHKKDWSVVSNWKLKTSEHWEHFNAYSVAELGEMLPEGIKGGIDKDDNFYSCDYKKNAGDWCASTERHCNMRDENLANAMAQMLIYLKENNLI